MQRMHGFVPLSGNTSSRVVIDVSCQVLNGDQLSPESWMNKTIIHAQVCM